MNLFRRVIELVVGGKLLKIPLTINFDVQFDDSEKINEAVIKVYNLSESTIAAIKKDGPVILRAGYETGSGLIFQGIVDDAETYWQGVDKITEIQCTDESKDYLKAKVTKAFAPGTTSDDILQYLISEAILGIGDFSPVKTVVYRKGKTLKGNVDKLLKDVVKETNSKMHIHRGRIYIRDPKKGDATGFVVNKESGLIGHPEKIEKEEETKGKGDKITRNGYKVVTLLNHQVTVDSVIVLQSKVANAQVRVSKGRHYCDGNSFYTEMECY